MIALVLPSVAAGPRPPGEAPVSAVFTRGEAGCATCHASPALTSAAAAVPRAAPAWAREPSAGFVNAYGPTFGGAKGTQSQRCLVCHDGTVSEGRSAHGRDGEHPIAVKYAETPSNGSAPYYGRSSAVDSSEYNDFDPITGRVAHTQVRLYADPDAPSSFGVECTSCHDPHGGEPHGALRADPTGSGLCLSCHRK